jgi:hypothetical protein
MLQLLPPLPRQRLLQVVVVMRVRVGMWMWVGGWVVHVRDVFVFMNVGVYVVYMCARYNLTCTLEST